MSARTVFLCRLIGLYLVLASLAMMVNKQGSVLAMNGFIGSAPLHLLSGVIAVFAGLAVVLGHNVWTGGAAPILVTLIGWMALLKGMLFLCVPTQTLAAFFEAMRFGDFFYLFAAIDLVVGAYLAWAGFSKASG